MRRPNYGQERADRNRKKAERREERLAAKAARSKRARDGEPNDEPDATIPEGDEDKKEADTRS